MDETAPGHGQDREHARTSASTARPERELIDRELVGRLIAAFYRVYDELGVGFLESVYANALASVLRESGMKVAREAVIQVRFHGRIIGFFRADLLVEGRVVVETETADSLSNRHLAQLINYLRASDLQVGLILCFGEHPRFKRVVCSNTAKSRNGNR